MIRPDDGPTIVWFRDDLRVSDNPALTAAIARGAPVVAVFVFDEESSGIRPLGSASRWWLHHSLLSLRASLEGLGGRLLLRRGAAQVEIARLIGETGAGAITWNRRYGGAERAVDTAVKADALAAGVIAHSFGASLLFEPWTVQTNSGGEFSVFSPFWRACQAGAAPRHPLAAPDRIDGVDLPGDDLDDWGLLPTRPDWAGGLRAAWTPGEDAAQDRLAAFVDEKLAGYAAHRDEPGTLSTSRLSPHLRWGEISPFSVWHAASAAPASKSRVKFLSELGWREFSYHLLFHRPDLASTNYRSEFDRFPWVEPKPRLLAAWQQGKTGVPLVDAGMRELWQTGYLHNRVRMVTASFLVKNLMVDWRIGEEWFWDTLVDADPASNAASWQWVAGSGADAAPYFRIFNPILQAEKFDPESRYIRAFVPEVDTADFPRPIVDLAESRRIALAAFERLGPV